MFDVRILKIRKAAWRLTARNSCTLYLKAVHHMKMDVQKQQQALAELVEKQHEVDACLLLGLLGGESAFNLQTQDEESKFLTQGAA